MKKICFITQGELPIPATKGGAVETLVEYIIEKNEINHDFEIDVYTISDETIKDVVYKNTKLIKFEKSSSFLNKIWDFVYRVLKKCFHIYVPYSMISKRMLKQLEILGSDQYDYIIYEAGPTTQVPLIAKLVNKNKLLVHLHWDGCANKKIDNSFGFLIPVSDYIGKNWQKSVSRDDEHIKILRNCAPVERFTNHSSIKEQISLRKKLGIGDDTKVVIYTGRIVWEKGVKELIRALELIDMSNSCLLIIGSANFGNATLTDYEKQVQELINNATYQIVFTGFVHQTELYKYYDLAEVAVMPSQFQDPAPLVCIETQATGTPLIATRVGGIPEYVTEDSAILVDKNEEQEENIAKAIELLLNDENKQKLMSLAGVENSKRYTVTQFYQDFVELINGLDKNE